MVRDLCIFLSQTKLNYYVITEIFIDHIMVEQKKEETVTNLTSS